MPNPTLSTPAIERLCGLVRVMERLAEHGHRRTSSRELGMEIGAAPHNVRKDISGLGVAGETRGGYDIESLRGRIGEKLGLNRQHRVGIVGLGRLGSALMHHHGLEQAGYGVVAGFDSDVNKLETIRTHVPLFPAYEIPEIVRRESIEIGVIAVPASGAREVCSRLVRGGIKGIINFAPIVVHADRRETVVRNVDITAEFMAASARITLDADFEESALRHPQPERSPQSEH